MILSIDRYTAQSIAKISRVRHISSSLTGTSMRLRLLPLATAAASREHAIAKANSICLRGQAWSSMKWQSAGRPSTAADTYLSTGIHMRGRRAESGRRHRCCPRLLESSTRPDDAPATWRCPQPPPMVPSTVAMVPSVTTKRRHGRAMIVALSWSYSPARNWCGSLWSQTAKP